MTTLNIPSWLVLWFVPSISELILQGCSWTTLPEIIQVKYMIILDSWKTIIKTIVRGANMFHSSKAVPISKRVFVSKFLQQKEFCQIVKLWSRSNYQRRVNLEAYDFTIWTFKNVWRCIFVKKTNANLKSYDYMMKWWYQQSIKMYIYRVDPDSIELVKVAIILSEVEVHFPSQSQWCGSSICCRVGLIIICLVLIQQIYNWLEKVVK